MMEWIDKIVENVGKKEEHVGDYYFPISTNIFSRVAYNNVITLQNCVVIG